LKQLSYDAQEISSKLNTLCVLFNLQKIPSVYHQPIVPGQPFCFKSALIKPTLQERASF